MFLEKVWKFCPLKKKIVADNFQPTIPLDLTFIFRANIDGTPIKTPIKVKLEPVVTGNGTPTLNGNEPVTAIPGAFQISTAKNIMCYYFTP